MGRMNNMGSSLVRCALLVALSACSTAPRDHSGDAGLDVGADGGVDAHHDGAADAARDGGVDTPYDGKADTHHDSGVDGGSGAVEFSSSVIVDGDLTVRNGFVSFIADTSPLAGPELHWIGNRGSWLTGIDVANNGGSRDFVVAAKKNWPQPGAVNDVLYI